MEETGKTEALAGRAKAVAAHVGDREMEWAEVEVVKEAVKAGMDGVRVAETTDVMGTLSQ